MNQCENIPIDVTRYKDTLKILQEKEEKYRTLFTTMNEGVILLDVLIDNKNKSYNYIFAEVNPAFENFFGLNRNSIIGKKVSEVIPFFEQALYEVLSNVVENKQPVTLQKHFPEHNKYCEINICNSSSKQIAVFIFDITKPKLLEQQLQEQLHFLQNLINTIPNPVFYKDINGVYQGCNTAFGKVMGLPQEQIIGKTFHDIAPREVADQNQVMDELLLENLHIQSYDGILPYADGTLHDVIYNKATIFNMSNQLLGLVGVTVDITQRKKAETALSISEEKFRNIFSQSPIGIALLDANGILEDANKAYLDIFGVSNLNEITGFNLFSDPNLTPEIKRKLLNGEVIKYEGEFNFNKIREYQLYKSNKSGYCYLDSLITPLNPCVGSSGFLLQVQDITEQKKSDIALKERENQLSRITENMLDIICETNTEGIIQYISPSVKSVLGYEPDYMMGLNIWAFTHPDDINKVGARYQKPLHEHTYGKLEFRYRHKDGRWVWLETVGNPLLNDTGQIIGIVFGTRDITDRKQIEKEIARLDRLRLAGEMAATIGHEIRNPMTTVHGFLQILRNDFMCRDYQAYFDLMIDELNATNSIITEFLSLAQDKAIYLQLQNLNTIIKSLYPLLSADAVKSDKQIILELDEIDNVYVDRNEIRQMILNLTLNGLEAMEPGGQLIIKTFNEDDTVVLAVKDEGPGIDPGIIEKLGTPFITTKENGTGLGLPVCYSIAARHNATIDIKTSPKGTTFMVKFNKFIK